MEATQTVGDWIVQGFLFMRGMGLSDLLFMIFISFIIMVCVAIIISMERETRDIDHE